MLSTKPLSLLLQRQSGRRLLALVAAVFASTTHGLDEHLWLPADMAGLMPDLEQAAAAALATERCGEVLRGKWSRNYSTDEHPAFMLICRDAGSGSSYYLIYRRVAANRVELFKEQPPASQWRPSPVKKASETSPSVETPGTVAEPSSHQVDSTPEQQPPGPPPDVELAWQQCLQSLRQRTLRMLDVIIYEHPRPDPEADQGGWRFRISFDARNPLGDDLYFEGICQAGAGGVSLELKPRRD